jgi:transglutaminase-like putative cysteine protease
MLANVAGAALIDVANGVQGVKETLRVMKSIAREFRNNPAIIQLAQQLTSGIPEKAWTQQVVALHRFVRDSIRYTLDTNDIEVLRTPQRLLADGQGDCDDKATLLATLLEAIGHPARFVAVGFQPGVLEHVLVETKVAEDWIPLETTERVEIGWYPPGVTTRYVVNV